MPISKVIWRAQHFDFELRHNCLITIKPIVFLSKRRSLVPHYLQEHGYEVIDFSPSQLSNSQRRRQLLAFAQLSQRAELNYHFIADESSRAELSILCTEYGSVVASANIKQHIGLANPVFSHRHRQKILLNASEYLDLAVRLAEQDMT